MKTSQKIQILFLVLFLKLNLLAQDNQYTSSIKIYPDSLMITNEMSVADFLQGRISGLDIIAASGDPGRNAQMILRGQNISGLKSPLIVIDGVPWVPT